MSVNLDGKKIKLKEGEGVLIYNIMITNEGRGYQDNMIDDANT